MTDQTREEILKAQQEFLRGAKEKLGFFWDELAAAIDVRPRTMATWHLPPTSKCARIMPEPKKQRIENLLREKS